VSFRENTLATTRIYVLDDRFFFGDCSNTCFRLSHTCFVYECEIGVERNKVIFKDEPINNHKYLVESSTLGYR